MKNICKTLLIGVLFVALSGSAFAQERTQENHGNALNLFVKFRDNSSISGNYEFQVHPDITVAPMARIWFGGKNTFSVGARADYYFDRLFKLPQPWDIWGGVDAGFVIAGESNKDDFSLNLHIGGEYKFNDMWGLILEFGGGSTSSGGIGVGIHF